MGVVNGNLGGKEVVVWRGEPYVITLPRYYGYYGAGVRPGCVVGVVTVGALAWVSWGRVECGEGAVLGSGFAHFVHDLETWLKTSLLGVSAFIQPSITLSSTMYEIACGNTDKTDGFGVAEVAASSVLDLPPPPHHSIVQVLDMVGRAEKRRKGLGPLGGGGVGGVEEGVGAETKEMEVTTTLPQ